MPFLITTILATGSNTICRKLRSADTTKATAVPFAETFGRLYSPGNGDAPSGDHKYLGTFGSGCDGRLSENRPGKTCRMCPHAGGIYQ